MSKTNPLFPPIKFTNLNLLVLALLGMTGGASRTGRNHVRFVPYRAARDADQRGKGGFS